MGDRDRREKSCIVCYRYVRYFSVGICEHSVCFECSARMRVLLEQNECPICRQKLEHVIYSYGSKSYQQQSEKMRMFIFLPQYGIYMEDERIQRQFDLLLEHRCKFCKENPPSFPTFAELKTHVQRTHELFACDLCTEHIKLFSKERKFYNRSDLGYHRRKGDRSDKSHKGHPLCQFCDRRFFDNDELFKHLRKDHYYCHFCDADGFNHYYNSYDDLRVHFRCEHFLCEEEFCKDEKFTTVFRTEIDLKAHLASVHSRLLGKHGTKQTRELNFEFARPPRPDEERRFRKFNREGGPRSQQKFRMGGEEIEEANEPTFEPPIVQPKIDTESAVDFPSLVEQPNSSLSSQNSTGTTTAGSSVAQKVGLRGGLSASSTKKGSNSNTTRTTWNAKVTGQNKMAEEFPALNGEDDDTHPKSNVGYNVPPYSQKALSVSRSRISKPGTSNKSLKKESTFTEDFPSLDGLSLSSTLNNCAWKASRKTKQQPRTTKVAPAPKLDRKIEVEESDSFQFVPLSANKAKKDALLNSLSVNQESDSQTKGRSETDVKKKAKNKGSTGPGGGGGDSQDLKKEKEHAKAASAVFNGGQFANKEKSSKHQNQKDPFLEDFPSLAPSNQIKTSNSLLQNGSLQKNSNDSNSRTSHPPGFNPKPTNFTGASASGYSSICSAPPGFSTRPEFNNNDIDLDFEAKIKSANAKGNLYVQPPDFTKRGQRLFERMKDSLGADESSWQMFRSMMTQYRKNEMTSLEFYELCRDMFGTTDLKKIFPELLALLPDIPKQQELLYAHRKSGGQMTGLTSCADCLQVLNAGDMAAHVKIHAEGELFPAL